MSSLPALFIAFADEITSTIKVEVIYERTAVTSKIIRLKTGPSWVNAYG